MNKTKFTPGPLHVGKITFKGHGWKNPSIPVRTETGTLVAACRHSDLPAFTREIAIANAHLFAAAPDLLPALEGMVESYDIAMETLGVAVATGVVDGSFYKTVEPARAAIAKAKGETQ